jgi:hypothetical protein
MWSQHREGLAGDRGIRAVTFNPMQLAPLIFRQRRRLHRPGEKAEAGQDVREARVGLPLYLSGARKAHAHNFGSISGVVEGQDSANEIGAELEEQDLPTLSGEGPTTHTIAYGLALHGRTDADFIPSFSTEGGRTRPARGCAECGTDDPCVRATGTLVSTFEVATTVTLPSVDDFPNLTTCQRDRVRNAITNVLAPHEQQHVRAFRTYNGTIRTPFDLKTCESNFDGRIESLHNSIEARRRSAAQAQSDTLDPFHFEVDLNCRDNPTAAVRASTSR